MIVVDKDGVRHHWDPDSGYFFAPEGLISDKKAKELGILKVDEDEFRNAWKRVNDGYYMPLDITTTSDFTEDGVEVSTSEVKKSDVMDLVASVWIFGVFGVGAFGCLMDGNYIGFVGTMVAMGLIGWCLYGMEEEVGRRESEVGSVDGIESN